MISKFTANKSTLWQKHTGFSVDFAKTEKRGESLLGAYDKYRSIADPKVCCDYGLSVVITEVNEKVKREMTELVENKGKL